MKSAWIIFAIAVSLPIHKSCATIKEEYVRKSLSKNNNLVQLEKIVNQEVSDNSAMLVRAKRNSNVPYYRSGDPTGLVSVASYQNIYQEPHVAYHQSSIADYLPPIQNVQHSTNIFFGCPPCFEHYHVINDITTYPYPSNVPPQLDPSCLYSPLSYELPQLSFAPSFLPEQFYPTQDITYAPGTADVRPEMANPGYRESNYEQQSLGNSPLTPAIDNQIAILNISTSKNFTDVSSQFSSDIASDKLHPISTNVSQNDNTNSKSHLEISKPMMNMTNTESSDQSQIKSKNELESNSNRVGIKNVNNIIDDPNAGKSTKINDLNKQLPENSSKLEQTMPKQSMQQNVQRPRSDLQQQPNPQKMQFHLKHQPKMLRDPPIVASYSAGGSPTQTTYFDSYSA